MGFIDSVKTWFVTRAKPTQAQYHALFDYLWFKDQPIPIESVESLTTLLQSKLDVSVYEATMISLTVEEVPVSGDVSLSLQGGHLLEKLILLPSADAPIKVGLTEGGDELFPENVVNQGEGEVLTIDLYAVELPRQVYLSGFPAGSSVVKFIRKIKTIEP